MDQTTLQKSQNNTMSINNEHSISDIDKNNTLSESLRINLFKNMENMKRIFKQNRINFEEYLDRKDYLRILDKNMSNNKKYDRSTAEKIFSVIDWNKDGRVSA